MSDRHPDLSGKWVQSVPGPGAYENIKVVNQDAKGYLSKHISTPSTKFGKQQRLSEAEICDPKTPGSNLCKKSIMKMRTAHKFLRNLCKRQVTSFQGVFDHNSQAKTSAQGRVLSNYKLIIQ